VREAATQSVHIKNSALSVWRIQPVIQHDAWEGPETLEIKPGETGEYKMTYKPVLMTQAGSPDQGKAFFPLPDGTGLLYHLEGTADAPAPEGTVTATVPAKTKHAIVLKLNNWLPTTQRFDVTVTRDSEDETVTLKGHDFVDVPGMQEYGYTLTFLSHKETTCNAQVTFTNPKSGEYIKYAVQARATAPQVASHIDLSAAVRQLVTHTLDLDNPLSLPVSLELKCDLPEVTVPPALHLGAGAAATVPIAWRPLVKGERSATLTVSAPELGATTHSLRLRASDAADMRTLQFRAGLGAAQTQTFRFSNFLRGNGTAPIVYKASVRSGPDFEVEVKDVQAPPADGTQGTDVSVDVKFEPSRVGEVRDTLTISHPEGGEYVCDLVGTGSLPGRAGPIVIRSGQTVQVPFKNVLASNAEFVFTCSPATMFTVAKAKETVPPKKGINIGVAFKPTPDIARDPKDKNPPRLAPIRSGASSLSWPTRPSRPQAATHLFAGSSTCVAISNLGCPQAAPRTAHARRGTGKPRASGSAGSGARSVARRS